jgi:uncharacterized protein YjiS (DUF1127 family)
MSRLVKIERLPALPASGLRAKSLGVAPHAGDAISGPRRVFERAAATLRQWGCRIRSRRQLRSACELDDRLLRDIGLRRAELHREIAKPFWR